MKNNISKLFADKFSFLEKKYGFKRIKNKKETWGQELIYINKFTGIKITYEYKEGYIFILLYKLLNGKLIENPIIIKPNSVLYGYGLDDVISLKNPSDLIKPTYNYSAESKFLDAENGLGFYIDAFVNNLEKYAIDIFNGDFSIFSTLHKIVKKRIET